MVRSTRENFFGSLLDKIGTIRSFPHDLTLIPELLSKVNIYGLRKYLSDAFSVALFPDVDLHLLYDILISDKELGAKCVLHPSLNHMVKSGTILEGDFIKITKCRLILHLPADLPILVIMGLEKVVVQSSRQRTFVTPSLWINCKDEEEFFRPLASRRHYYMCLYSDDIPLIQDPSWSVAPSNLNATSLPPAMYSSLSKATKMTKALIQPVLCRILAKSRLNHYGKANSTVDDVKYPWQFLLLLGDSTFIIQCAVWNDLCPALYYHLEIGDVVLVYGARIRANTVDITPNYGYELTLNPSHPKGAVIKVPSSLLSSLDPSILAVPENTIQAEIGNQFTYIVEGMIIYVGPIMRDPSIIEMPSKDGQVPYRKFTEYRWIKMLESTKGKEVSVKIFSCASPKNLHSIVINSYIKIYCVKHVAAYDSNSHFYTTTYFSQYYVAPLQLDTDILAFENGYIGGFSPQEPSSQLPLLFLREVVHQFPRMEIRELIHIKTRAKIMELNIPNHAFIHPRHKKRTHQQIQFSSNVAELDEYSTDSANIELTIFKNAIEDTLSLPSIEVTLLQEEEALDLKVNMYPRLSQCPLALCVGVDDVKRALYLDLACCITEKLGGHKMPGLLTSNDIERLIQLVDGNTFEFTITLWKETATNLHMILKSIDAIIGDN